MRLVVFTLLDCLVLYLTFCSSGATASLSFLKPPKSPIIALTGNAVLFNCTASDPSAQVSLLFQKQQIQEKDISHNRRVLLTGQIFQLRNVTIHDGGHYFCVATMVSSGQTIKTPLGTLLVFQAGYKYPTARMVDVIKTVEVLSDVNLTCYSYGGAVRHVWFRNGKLLPGNNIETKTKRSRGKVVIESILHLYEVKPKDAGEYVCRVNNSFTPGYEHNASTILQITGVEPLSWIHEFDGGIYYHGDPLVFNCSLTWPWLSVSLWQDDGSGYKRRVPNERLFKTKQIFKIDEINRFDAGVYQCRADNIEPHNILQVHTSTGVPKPEPMILWNRRQIEFGDHVTLTCKALGGVMLKWFKRHHNGSLTELPGSKQTLSSIPMSGRHETKKIVTIQNFTISSAGYYRCTLERPLVKWRSFKEELLELKNFSKPRFTDFPAPVVSYRQGSRHMYIDIFVDGSPKPIIRWYLINDDNTETLVAVCRHPSSPCERENTTRKLEIVIEPDAVHVITASLDKNHDIKLKCVAKNYVGSVEKSFHLIITAIPKIAKGSKDIGIVSMRVNDPETKIKCTVKEAYPRNITYSWEIQTYSQCSQEAECKPREKNWNIVVPSEKHDIKSDNLQSVLTLKKNSKTLFIRCNASNSEGTDSHVWKLIILAESDKLLKSLNGAVTTDEGSNVSFSWEADPSVISVAWKRNDVDLTFDSRLAVTRTKRSLSTVYTLNINKANLTDNGKYTCVGFRDGQDPISESIVLTVRDLQVPVAHLMNLIVMQPARFRIKCNTTGYPEPAITWSREGQQLLNIEPLPLGMQSCRKGDHGFYRVPDDDNSVLIICNSDYKKHAGLFTCTASNRLGSHSVNATVKITAVPAIIDLKEQYEASIGQNFSVTCFSDGNPKPRVWWEKKEDDTFHRVKDARLVSNELTIETVEKQHLGAYRCVAKNKFKKVTKKVAIVKSVVIALSHQSGMDNSKKYMVVIGCISFAAVLIAVIFGAILYKRKRTYGGFYILTLPPYPDYIKKLDPHTPITQQTNKLPYDAEWEFPRNRLTFSRELGSGAFGKVYLAEAVGIVAFDPRGSIKRRSTKRRFGGARKNHYVNNNKMTKVAVKILKEDAGETEYKDLLSELKILIHVGEHKNIVNLLGACTKGRECELWIIIEYCSNGNLLQFLRNRRDIYETEWKAVSKDPNQQLTMTDLVIAAYQVARGMEFLSSRMCIHRDLATRNILVTDNYVIKIADFGLARDVGEDSQYVKTSTGLLPVKWMAIEAIMERLFTEKSDVWSFGIVLWELFTLGGTPYPNISPNEVCEFLALGNRMDAPHACPDEMSSLMTACWQDDRDDRPNFKELVEHLDKIIDVHTSSEGGCGYLEVQGDEGIDEYLLPSDVKSPHHDPFELNSPLPPIPSPGMNETDSLLDRDQNARAKWFNFDKSGKNKAPSQDNQKAKDMELQRRGSDIDGYIDPSLAENERKENGFAQERESSKKPLVGDGNANWAKSTV